MDNVNDKYVYIKELADTLGIYAVTLEEKPEQEKYNKSLLVESFKKDGYTVEDNDSMDILAVKEGKTMNLEFQESDEKIVSTSFAWKEVRIDIK